MIILSSLVFLESAVLCEMSWWCSESDDVDTLEVWVWILT